MKTSLFVLLFVCVLSGPVMAEFEPPDLSDLDRDGLEVLALQLFERVHQLESRIERMEAAAAEEAESSWVVDVITNEKPDVSGLESDLEQLRNTDRDILGRLATARERLESMKAERETYIDRRGRQRTRAKHGQRELAIPEKALSDLESERRRVTGDLRRVQRELTRARNLRQVSGRLEDGRLVTLVLDGVHAQLADLLREGGTYEVGGVDRLDRATPVVHVRTVAEVTAPSVAERDENAPPLPPSDSVSTEPGPPPGWYE